MLLISSAECVVANIESDYTLGNFFLQIKCERRLSRFRINGNEKDEKKE